MNPCTLGFYLPLIVRDVPSALQPSESDGTVARRAPSASSSSSTSARRPTADVRVSPGKRRRSASPPPSSSSRPSSSSSSSNPTRPTDAKAQSDAALDRERAQQWRELDVQYRRDLPDAAYAARLAYRGLVMRACPALRTLDGLDVAEKEREKAERLLKSVLDARRNDGLQAARGQGDGERRGS